MRRVIMFLLGFMFAGSVQRLYAQEDSTLFKAEHQFSSAEDDFFRSLMPHRDSTFLLMMNEQDTFIKRLSFHANLLDWVLTIPSLGIELDVNSTKKNNKSLLLFAKYNGETHHTVHPKFVFNVMTFRGEFRKYWRTGQQGNTHTHTDYVKLFVHKPDTLWEVTVDSSRYVPITTRTPYFTRQDSIYAKRYNGNPYHGWFYNYYNKIRRNVTSSRTIEKPRNWRAYYMGVYASFDKYCLSFSKKGKQGSLLSLGLTMGWSIPIMPSAFPKESGLDFDIGANIGVGFVKNQSFRYLDESHCYVSNGNDKKFHFVNWPMVQELHVALVYRFRNVTKKVSLELIDDYEIQVRQFEEKIASEKLVNDELSRAYENSKDSLMRARVMSMDSTAYWNQWHKRRLENARRINPDTIFTELDDTLYQKIFQNIDLRNMSKDELKKRQRIEEKQRKKEDKKKNKESFPKQNADTDQKGGKK